jgi:hypothetical protein
MKDSIKEISGANMDIDFFPADVDWKQGKCPWNEADGKNCHKCADKGISICKYFRGMKKWDIVLCSYPKDKV